MPPTPHAKNLQALQQAPARPPSTRWSGPRPVMKTTPSSLAARALGAIGAVMVLTTVPPFFVIRYGWKLPLPLCIAASLYLMLAGDHQVWFSG